MSVLIAIALAAMPAQATPVPGAAAATVPVLPAYSTTATPVGTLIADPAAKAILEKYLPGISTNPQLTMVIGLPLKSIQPYAADKITDEKLASIDADLARLPKAK